MKYKDQLFSIINIQPIHLEILKAVRDLELNDCWIGAGFIRNAVWDKLHEIKSTVIDYDIDVVFYDSENTYINYEKELENKLGIKIPNIKWSVKNQARMHIKNGQDIYKNVFDAISYWPETETSIAINIDTFDNLDLIAPHGLEDLFNLIIRPTPNFNINIVEKRLADKRWQVKWRKLVYVNS